MSTIAVDGTVFTNPARFADHDDWHAVVAELRATSPVCWVDVEGFPPFWAITRHADVSEIEKNDEVFRNTANVEFQSLEASRVAAEQGTAPETLVHMDGARHRAYRGLTSPWFKPSALRATMEESVRVLSREYVDRMAAMGDSCDFAADIAKFYPLRVIMSILGVPQEDEPLMLTLTQQIMAPGDPEYARSGDYAQDHAATINEVFGYFFALAAARRENPTADLASVIANGSVDGAPLGDLATLSYYLILASAGHDTTSAVIAAGVEALASHPDQLRMLQADPSLIPNAVEEILRWSTPVKQFTRTAQVDYDLHGTTIRAGDLVLISFQSACRDEEVFPDPFRFDITRPNANRNLSLGAGRHFCLGAPLARMELIAFFTEMLGRIDTIEVSGPAERSHGSTVSGIKRLPVRYSFSA